MSLGQAYLQQYLNGNAGMFFGNSYGCNVGSWYGGNSVSTNIWGEVAGMFTGYALMFTPSIIAACKADKQAKTSAPTVDYDAKISAKKTEITTALSGLKLSADEAIEKGNSLTVEDLLPSSFESKITSTNETLTQAKSATDNAQIAVNENDNLITTLEAKETAGTISDEEKTQLSNAKREKVKLNRALTDAQTAESNAQKAYDAAVKAKADKETAIETALPNIKKLIGEYNDLVKAKSNTETAQVEAEETRMTDEVNNKSSFKKADYSKIWDGNSIEFKTGLSEKEYRKAYTTALQGFINAIDDNEKAMWAHRAVKLYSQVEVNKLSSSERQMIKSVSDFAKKHSYNEPIQIGPEIKYDFVENEEDLFGASVA